jgi:hypothetical protein
MKLLLFKITVFVAAIFIHSTTFGQGLSGFNVKSIDSEKSVITQTEHFNGYTNHWQDNYTELHRYGNMFKMGMPELEPTVLQSKVDIAEDMGIPGLLMQEGFISTLFSHSYKTVKYPSADELGKIIGEGNTLVITDPSSEAGKLLENKALHVFEWKNRIHSHQFDAIDYEEVKAFYLVNDNNFLFVISSSAKEQAEQLLALIENTRSLLDKYKLAKGWFGVSSMLKSVTCEAGHPLELIGKGLNEGVSWFVFDGYMDFMAKDEIANWVEEVDMPVVTDAGFSPVYGCENYDGLQVQNMATKDAWIKYAHERGGYAFRPVYDPSSDGLQYDGYIVHEGNKEQIDNEDVPFVNKTGYLSGNLTSSMVLFIEKEKPLSRKSVWEAILNRQEVAVLEKANMLGPAEFRNALQLLYLDRYFLENYFGDRLNMEARLEGYDLVVTLKNYTSASISGKINVGVSSALKVGDNPKTIVLDRNEEKQIRVPLMPNKEAMGRTNPVAVKFSWDEKEKSTLTMLDLPPVASIHQLLYAHAPNVHFPVTVHNYTDKESFPVEIKVFEKENRKKAVYELTETCKIPTASFKDMAFDLKLEPGKYLVEVSALGCSYESQLGVGKAEGRPYVYEMDLNSDGINEYRMENDSVQITLLRTGARVIEYIVKSKNDNVLFKAWPEKTINHKRAFRERGYYPYGGFEDFLGQASMETHRIYDARIIREEGDYVRVEMETDYFGNRLKKIFTLYGNSPLLEVRFALTFKNPEANVLGPQPILEIGETHGTEDVFTVPEMDGNKEYRMRPEEYYGMAFNIREGWNAGYDTREDITFVGAFPVKQPLFLHMWMNHPRNGDAPHYYMEFQPWTPIIQKSTMHFSYYLWGSSGGLQNSLDALREKNLITTR